MTNNFRGRSLRLRRSAGRILVLVVAILLAGISVFVAAGTLANRETTAAVDQSRHAALQSLEKERAALKDEQRRVADAIENTRMKIVEEGGGHGSGPAGYGPIVVSLERQLADLLERSNMIAREIAAVDAQTVQSSVPATVSIPKEAQMASLISSISTRIAAVLLLVFLVQILVPLYRYTVKLSAHYDACADALELAFLRGDSVEIETFIRLIEALLSRAADFGVAPAMPAEEIMKLALDVAAKR